MTPGRLWMPSCGRTLPLLCARCLAPSARAICYELEKVMRGDTQRLIITMPPRYLKSICASVAFPAWVLGHDPTQQIICVSYAQDLATKHGNDCRAVMTSDW